MKTTAILLISCSLLLFSCKKDSISRQRKSVGKQQIEKWYNTAKSVELPLDSIAAYAAKMENAAIKQPNEYKAMAAYIRGVYYSGNSTYELAAKSFEKGLLLLGKSKADTLKAKIYNALGSNYKTRGDYPKAFGNLYKSLRIYEKKHNNVGICSVQTAICEVYFQKDDIKSAKEHIDIALKALEKEKSNPSWLAAAHLSANIYGMGGDFQKALEIDREGIRISDSINLPKLKSPFLDNKANCFFYTNQLDSAEYYFNECLKIDLSGGNKKQIADSYSNLAQVNAVKKNFAKAEQFAFQSIDLLKSIDGKPNLGKSYSILTDIYADQGEFQKALEAHNAQYLNYKAMIAEKEAASLAEFQIVYETQQKENKIQLLRKENKIKNLHIAEQNARMFWLVVSFLLLIAGVLIAGYFRKRGRELKNLLEREKAVRETEEHERIRMARDIHDDLGSGLSKINLLSEIISRKSEHLPEIRNSSESVKETAKRMTENMRDLIWALHPENMTIANFVARMREYTSDYLEDFPVVIRYDIPETLPELPISKENHRELFMVVKETLNNISKHAIASEVFFSVALSDDELQITIQDNGTGFDSTENVAGNGLRNMKNRLSAIGGTFGINSSNSGTTVSVAIKLSEKN
ncbi:MAG TPA: sensor histidine kinase [Flavobacterium sp.]|nr:sensor histidine kinase [Flavobacterium sp.]